MDSDRAPKPTLLMAVLPIVLPLALLMLQLFVFDDFGGGLRRHCRR